VGPGRRGCPSTDPPGNGARSPSNSGRSLPASRLYGVPRTLANLFIPFLETRLSEYCVASKAPRGVSAAVAYPRLRCRWGLGEESWSFAASPGRRPWWYLAELILRAAPIPRRTSTPPRNSVAAWEEKSPPRFEVKPLLSCSPMPPLRVGLFGRCIGHRWSSLRGSPALFHRV
jgi:hypothetical protein